MNEEHIPGLRRWRIAEFCWRRILRRRSTGGPTASETSPPRAPGQIQVCYRDFALDARGVGSGLGSWLLIEFDGPAIGGFTTQPHPLVRGRDYRRQQWPERPARSKLSPFRAAKIPFC